MHECKAKRSALQWKISFHNIILYFILYFHDSLLVKRDLIPNIIHFVCELPHELLNGLELRASQNWMATKLSTQSSLQNRTFGYSYQKLRKSRYQSFLSCLMFIHFLSFCQKFCPWQQFFLKKSFCCEKSFFIVKSNGYVTFLMKQITEGTLCTKKL